MCTASFSLLVCTALGITASAYYLPAEGDYELIPEMDIEPDDQFVYYSQRLDASNKQQTPLPRRSLG